MKVICPKCHNEMKNLGNISGIVMTSYPPQWEDTYVCDDCKTKKDIRVSGSPVDHSYVNGYTQV